MLNLRHIIVLTCCLLSHGAMAQDSIAVRHKPQPTSTRSGFWDRGVGKLLKMGDDMLKQWESEGIDTNYIKVPEKDRMVYMGAYSYVQMHSTHFPILHNAVDLPEMAQMYLPSNFEEKKYMSTSMTTFQTELELGIDWRGLAIELPIPIANRYNKSYGLAKNGSVWGARIRYKNLDNMTGTLDNPYSQLTSTIYQRASYDQETKGHLEENHDPVETHEEEIKRGQLDLTIFYLEGYYVFNYTKFSLSAGMYGDMIQRKSAGSLFVMGNYYQSRLGCSKVLNNDYDSFRNNKISLGAGYGYNWSFLDGRLCVHASLIPMVSLLNRVMHKGNKADDTPHEMTEEEKLWQSFNLHYYDACNYGRDSKFTLNGFGRFAINYSFDRYIVSFLANYRRYLFSSSSGMKIKNSEFDMQLNLGWRF